MSFFMASCGSPLHYGLRLRPCQEEDASFIYQLRSQAVISRFLNDPPASVEQQVEWMRAEKEVKGNMYFICEDKQGSPHGTISVYNVDGQSAEWGRWAMIPGSLAAFASVAGLFSLCFSALDFETLWSWTVLENRNALNFHAAIGLEEVPTENKQLVNVNGTYTLVAHRAERRRWAELREASYALAAKAERFFDRV